MIDKGPFYQSVSIRRNLVIISILLTLLLLFSGQLSEGLRSITIIVSILIKYNFWAFTDVYRQAFLNELTFQMTSVSLLAIIKFFLILIIGWLTWRTAIFFIAQFTLPVSAWEERRKATTRLISFVLGQHGPAIFIREGKQVLRQRDIESTRPGVLLIDLSSAVVLAQQENTQSWNLVHERQDLHEGKAQQLSLEPKKISSPFTKTSGPGIVFTESGEKIFSVLDLRRQSRSRRDVEGYTRNGIKVKATVSVSFSLSDEAELLTVGYVGESNHSKDIYGLVISETRKERKIKIEDVFKLSTQDAQEINSFVEKGGPLTYPEKSTKKSNSPYAFYENRVWVAAHSQARSSKSGEFLSWHQVPIELAIDRFRAKLATVPYDDLFTDFEGKDNIPAKQILEKIRSEFSQDITHKGMLSFQFFRRKDGRPFQKGMSLDSNLIIRYPSLAFSRPNSGILRKSGIVILSAGFGQITPIDPRIQLKLVENWKAKLEKEIDLINAEYELEAVRVRNRNRAQIQQEMTYLLSNIFQSTHTEEALALRIFQALEAAATNPANKELSPREILQMLQNLHAWLLVDRKDSSKHTPSSPKDDGEASEE